MEPDTKIGLRDAASGWDTDVDVLVFGSGVGGLSVALFAAKAGLSTLLCEKTDRIGGTTATSGGIAWIPGTRQARETRVDDTLDRARTYLQHELGNYYRSDLIEAFLESGGDALAELEDDTDVVFDLTPRADYHASAIGAVITGRSLEARKFDGRRLGPDFALVRPPLKRLMLLGGMFVNKRKVDDFLNPFRSWSVFGRVIQSLGRYALDRLTYERGTDLCAGNALVARYLLSLKRRSVPIQLNTPLVRLVVEDGCVVGAVAGTPSGEIRIRARRGVVLATGGFPRDQTMRAELAASHPHDLSVGFEGNVGDGIRAGRNAGAEIDLELASPGLWQPSSILRHPDGSRETIFYGYLDRGRPGVIAVDAAGRRFVNESNSYHDIGMAMFESGAAEGRPFYFICDHKFVWRHGLGLIRPFRFSLKRYVRSGYIQTAPSIAELARQIGLGATTLQATVDRHNDFARTGIDLDFGKGSNPYNHQFGVKGIGPNPNLAPIQDAPFVALRIYPSTLGTTVGLKTNADAQVMSRSGVPIPGLYACGNDLASIMRGFYPGGGITIGPAIVFAYRIIKKISSR